MWLRLRAVLVGCAVFSPGAALAIPPEAPAPTVAAPSVAAPAVAAAPVVPVVAGPQADAKAPGPRNETQQYCQNIAAAAADARFAWQRKQLNDLQGQLKQRIADLDVKAAELRALIAKRDEMMKKASDAVVGIYSHMKAEAAATQLATLDDAMAASILAQLSQRQASTILNEIPAERAAKLVEVLAGVPEKKS